jgi:hypothetical protein
MLAMNEPAAHIDRRAEKTFHPQGIKADSGPNGVHNRIDGPDLVKFHILRRDVVNLPLRDRQLRENGVGNPFRIRVQRTLPNHPEYL